MAAACAAAVFAQGDRGGDGQETPPSTSRPPEFVEAFPGVRLNAERRVVEFDGKVPIDAHHPDGGIVYLELMVCSPDTREHESLVVTGAQPSYIHAALLLVGGEPGEPGSWKQDGESVERVSPTGSPIRLEAIWRDAHGAEQTVPLASWVKAHGTGERFDGEWVFGGSRFVTRGEGEEAREIYLADPTGTVVGLTTFGSEVVALREVLSHAASVDAPAWIADSETIPEVGTPVTVRLTVDRVDAAEPEGGGEGGASDEDGAGAGVEENEDAPQSTPSRER